MSTPGTTKRASSSAAKAIHVAKAVIAAAVLLAPIVASAIPVTFRFEMPAFEAGTFVGQTSTLDVTVDNGSASILNQTYLNTDIDFYAVVIGALSLSSAVTSSTGSTTYITTNALGIPTLNLSADIDTDAIASFPPDLIQLGTRDGDGPTQYAVLFSGSDGAIPNDIVVVGVVVPEPATLALLGVALAGLGFARRRRAHGQT